MKPAIEQPKNQPNAKSQHRVNQSRLAACGLSKIAHIAGAKVNELNAEMMVDTAIAASVVHCEDM